MFSKQTFCQWTKFTLFIHKNTWLPDEQIHSFDQVHANIIYIHSFHIESQNNFDIINYSDAYMKMYRYMDQSLSLNQQNITQIKQCICTQTNFPYVRVWEWEESWGHAQLLKKAFSRHWLLYNMNGNNQQQMLSRKIRRVNTQT